MGTSTGHWMYLWLLAFLVCTVHGAGRGRGPITDAPPVQEFAEIGPLTLESGTVLPRVRVGYRMHRGSWSKSVILVPTWFTGTSEGAFSHFMHRYIDPRFTALQICLHNSLFVQVVFLDALANGVSSSPSNTEGFPDRVTIKVLHLSHVYAVVGHSMGAMQAYRWAVDHPLFMDKVVACMGTPKQTSADLMLWQTHLHILRSVPNPDDAYTLLAQVQLMHFTSPSYLARKYADSNAVTARIAEVRAHYVASMSLQDWACQVHAMLTIDIMDEWHKIKALLFTSVATHDHMVNPTNAKALAHLLNGPGDMQRSFMYVQIEGDDAHFAPSLRGAGAQKMQQFLNVTWMPHKSAHDAKPEL